MLLMMVSRVGCECLTSNMAFHRKLVATGAMGGLTDERRLSTVSASM